jgi:hypothetical protein
MRAYTLIEPAIYVELGWDLDLIVKCLEVIRLKMPQIIVENDEYDLIAVSNPHGKSYPVIGWVSISEVEQDWFEVEEKVELFVRNIGLENLIIKSRKIDYIDWGILEIDKVYPIRNSLHDTTIFS